MPATPHAHSSLLSGKPHPQTLYLQLHSGEPSSTGSLNATGKRMPFILDDVRQESVTGKNEQLFDIDTRTGVSHWSLWDSLTSGACWWYDEFDEPRNVLPGDAIRVAPGMLVLQLKGTLQ